MSRGILGKLSMGAIALAVAWAAGNANAACVVTQDGSGVQCQALIAGQHINVGSVCVEVVGSNLEITYTTTGGWTLDETHTHVGGGLGDLPQTNKGNPIPGHFTYKSGDITGSTSHTVVVPLSFQCGSVPDDDLLLFVATHAVVRNSSGGTETAWGAGKRFVTKGNWGTYFEVTLTCRCDDPVFDPPVGCQTGFAGPGYNAAHSAAPATCFVAIDSSIERWGWSIGPLSESPDDQVFPIYAGAGQCDVSKGTEVGILTVNYAGGIVNVSFSLYSGFTLKETHLYVGSEPLPRNKKGEPTVAPGQYPYKHQGLSGSLDIYSTPDLGAPLFQGPVYVVAHAVVCGGGL